MSVQKPSVFDPVIRDAATSDPSEMAASQIGSETVPKPVTTQAGSCQTSNFTLSGNDDGQDSSASVAEFESRQDRSTRGKEECLFCHVNAKEFTIVPVDELNGLIAFEDLYPASVLGQGAHVQIVPSCLHIESLEYLTPDDLPLLELIQHLAKRIQEKLFPGKEYRLGVHFPVSEHHFHAHVIFGQLKEGTDEYGIKWDPAHYTEGKDSKWTDLSTVIQALKCMPKVSILDAVNSLKMSKVPTSR